MSRGVCERYATAVDRLEGHHPTGRVEGVPVHPGFVAHICSECHADEHLVWSCAGLDDLVAPPALLLRRLAAWLGRWGRSLEPAHVVAVAEVAADLAERIEEER